MVGVYDETTADVAEVVYNELTSTGQFEAARPPMLSTTPSAACGMAATPPSAWAPFTHTGPVNPYQNRYPGGSYL